MELLCVYTASFTTGLYVLVCLSVCLQALCLSVGSHTHSGLRAALSPLVTTEQHCVSVSPTRARLPASHNRHSLMSTGSRPVGDDVWKIEPLCWLPCVLGLNLKIWSTGNAQFMWLMQACNKDLYHKEVPVHALCTFQFDWHLFLSESVHSDLNLLTLGLSYTGVVKPQKSVKSGTAFP